MDIVDAKIDRFDATQIVRLNLPKLNIDPPKGAVAVAGGATVTIYNSAVEKYVLGYCFLQNVGTNKLKYAINDNAGANNYSGILSPGVANEDGLGGSVEFPGFLKIEKLTVYAEVAAASQVAIVLGKNPFQTNPNN